MSGFGRTGRYFAISKWGVIPDIITFGKGVSGGYIPLAGMAVTDKIKNTIKKGGGKFPHGHTFSSVPITTAVGLAVCNYMESHGVIENARLRGEYLKRRLLELESLPLVGETRAEGLLAGIEIVSNKMRREPFKPELNVAERLTQIAVENGVVFYPGAGTVNGVAGDHLQISPPLTINNQHIDEIIDCLVLSIKQLENELC